MKVSCAAFARTACASASTMAEDMEARWCGKNALGDARDAPYTVVSLPDGKVAVRASVRSSMTSPAPSAPVLSLMSRSRPCPLRKASA